MTKVSESTKGNNANTVLPAELLCGRYFFCKENRKIFLYKTNV